MNVTDTGFGYPADAGGYGSAPPAPTDGIEAHVARIISNEELEELLEPFGGIEVVAKESREREANQQYVEANRRALKQQYPDQWVAVLHQQVVAHAQTADDVVEGARAAHENSRGMHLEYFSTKEQIWLL